MPDSNRGAGVWNDNGFKTGLKRVKHTKLDAVIKSESADENSLNI